MPSKSTAELLDRRGLVGKAQPLTACGQDAHRGRPREDEIDEIRRGVNDVLAVVEDQETDPALQRGSDRLTHRHAGLLRDAQHRGHSVRDGRRISHGRQFENTDSVRKFVS